MNCLLRYQWVKLPRTCLPQGKGILGAWARLAARAAFRGGQATYCGHRNTVAPGMWAGGIVGLKSILGVRSRQEALRILDALQELGYLRYTLDPATKKLEYRILDWVMACSGAACMDGAVYAAENYGFLCLPRSIPERLAAQQYRFEEADAWLDLWCHTVWQDPHNAFSHLAPVVQYGSRGAILTLETLGRRWGWEKTKVWRFFQKHRDVFPLHRLPGACGCLIFQRMYPTGTRIPRPLQTDITRILRQIRFQAQNTRISGTDHQRLNKMILWFSRPVIALLRKAQNQLCRVALSHPFIRAYYSLCRNCKSHGKGCGVIDSTILPSTDTIRGPCALRISKGESS